jgi:hypothetical protein
MHTTRLRSASVGRLSAERAASQTQTVMPLVIACPNKGACKEDTKIAGIIDAEKRDGLLKKLQV